MAASPTSSDQTGSLLLATLLGALVIVGVGGIALLAGRRRAEEEPEPALQLSGSTTPGPVDGGTSAAAFAARVVPAPNVPPPEPATPPRAAWDAYADIDNRPIGTVDELPPGDYQRRPHDDAG